MFTGGGIDALAPDADGNGGYAALSALPVFFGGNKGPFGPGVFTGGGINALSNYDALSAIPAYLNSRPPRGHRRWRTNIAPAQTRLVQESAPTTTPPTGSNPVKTFVASLPKRRLHTTCAAGVHPAGTSEGGAEGRGGGDSRE